MKKDIIIAVIVGFVLGVGSALLIVNLPSLLTLLKRTAPSQLATINPTPTLPTVSNTSSLLTLESPAPESIATSKNIQITGKTAPGTILVLTTERDNSPYEASESGNFAFPLSLKEGANTAIITAYNESGEAETKTLTIYYTSEKL
jgi:hypothetical protein